MICEHVPIWAASSSSPGIKDWQQGSCARCGTYAVFHDGSWKFAQLPQRVLALAAERENLRAVIATLRAYIAAPEGQGPLRYTQALALADEALSR